MNMRKKNGDILNLPARGGPAPFRLSPPSNIRELLLPSEVMDTLQSLQ